MKNLFFVGLEGKGFSSLMQYKVIKWKTKFSSNKKRGIAPVAPEEKSAVWRINAMTADFRSLMLDCIVRNVNTTAMNMRCGDQI